MLSTVLFYTGLSLTGFLGIVWALPGRNRVLRIDVMFFNSILYLSAMAAKYIFG